MSKRNQSSQRRAAPAWPGVFAISLPSFRILAGAALLVIIVFIAYFPSISGGFIWDDDKLLTDNRIIMAPDGLYRFWCTNESIDFWPATNTTFWLEWRLWEMHPTGYHVTNLILHIVEAMLVWILLRQLSIPGAFLAAVIFAIHPVNVESVAWIASRKNLMAMLFFLLSILWYLKHLRSRHTPCAVPAHEVCGVLFDRWYLLSLAAFILAMLGKGSAAVLPVLLLGIIWWEKTGTIPSEERERISVEKKGTVPLFSKGTVPFFSTFFSTVPFFLFAGILTEVNLWFQTRGTDIVYRSAGFLERLLGAAGVVWFYLYKAILPLDLALVYPRWDIQAGKLLWWLPLAGAIGVTAALWLFRGSWGRPMLFAWGFFCVALLPVLGFTDVAFMEHSLVADRYQHIAIIGAIALAAAGLSLWRDCTQKAARRGAGAAAVAAVAVLAFLTWQQSGVYRDAVTLYRTALEKNPNFWMGYYNLGIVLEDAGRPSEAIDQYLRAITVKPDYSDAHNNLGLLLIRVGRYQDAIAHYKEALRIKPDFSVAHNNLGNAYFETGRVSEAVDEFKAAAQHDPTSSKILYNLAVGLVQLSRPEEAIESYKKALEISPELPELHYSLGNVYAQVGQPEEAIKHYRQAVALRPNYSEAFCNLGAALVKAGRPQQAVEPLNMALQLNPEYIVAWKNLASTYASMNKPPEAIAAAQKALEIARSKGQAEQAKQTEEWLNTYRAGLSK